MRKVMTQCVVALLTAACISCQFDVEAAHRRRKAATERATNSVPEMKGLAEKFPEARFLLRGFEVPSNGLIQLEAVVPFRDRYILTVQISFAPTPKDTVGSATKDEPVIILSHPSPIVRLADGRLQYGSSFEKRLTRAELNELTSDLSKLEKHLPNPEPAVEPLFAEVWEFSSRGRYRVEVNGKANQP